MSKHSISNIRRTTVRAFSLGIVCGGFLTAGTIAAFPAKASPDTSLADIAVQEEPYVCNTLALKPTVSNLVTVLSAVQAAEHLTASDTGKVVTYAILDGCDQFVPVLNRFIAIYASGPTA
jgi:hypothetical protein